MERVAGLDAITLDVPASQRDAALSRLAADPGVRFAEPSATVHADSPWADITEYYADDPYLLTLNTWTQSDLELAVLRADLPMGAGYGGGVGLDAFVYCRCWQDGLTPSATVGPVGFDEEGYLSLLVTGNGHTAAYAAFGSWMASACSHELMEQASERLANWTGYRLFRQALRAAGWSHFPTLRGQLPSANGGRMSAEAAGCVLGELDYFEQQAVIADEVVLVDEATGAVALRYVAAYQGDLMWGPGYRAGVDPEGFFVVDPAAEPPATLFRSARFRQRMLPNGRVEFSDEAKTVRVVMPPVGGEATPSERLRLETRHQSPADFGYIVEPLRRLCQAAMATGNPVMWC